MKCSLLIVGLLMIGLFSCQKEVKEILGQPNQFIEQESKLLKAAVTSQKKQTYLNGYILNEQGLPLADAEVSCGEKTVLTNEKGFFVFKEVLDVNRDYALITVSKAGYRKGFRTFTPNRTKLAYHSEKIMLQADGIPQTIPASGGTITADGVKLTFPTYSIVKPSGAPYLGNVKVMVRYIDPLSPNFPLLVPGILSGLNTDGEINALQSFGMVNVEITDASGNKLEIGQGMKVKMELPAMNFGPASIPLWHFNEEYGIWVEQGTAVKTGNVYVAEVSHFSIWNVDLEFNDFELGLTFKTAGGAPISNLPVHIFESNDSYVSSFYTDNAGQAVLINCPSTQPLKLRIIYACDTIEYSLAPVTQSRDEIITLTAGISYDLTGSLKNCNSEPVKNQVFQVFLSNTGNFISLNGISDAQGNFSIGTILPSCVSNPQFTAQSSAFINNQYFLSAPVIVVPGSNSYNPQLCDSTGSAGQAFGDSDVVNIPDPNLLAKVRQTINKPAGTIYYVDVKNVKGLNADFSNIQSIVGLQYFTGLDTLILSSNQISDINPLKELTSIRFLHLGANPIISIEAVRQMHNLLELGLHEGEFTDFTPIAGLVNLMSLDLSETQLSDLSVIQNLTKLKYFYCDFTQVSSVLPLQSCLFLEYLGIDYCQITSLNGLQGLRRLKELTLNGNNVSSINQLQNLDSLTDLHLSNNNITSLASLQNLSNLTVLYSSSNSIADITGLQNKPRLKFLDLQSNQISNIGALQTSIQLEELNLSSNTISNLAGLQSLNQLKKLTLYFNQISDIQPLINGVSGLLVLEIQAGNTIPANQIISFQTNHPGCTVN